MKYGEQVGHFTKVSGARTAIFTSHHNNLSRIPYGEEVKDFMKSKLSGIVYVEIANVSYDS